MGYGQYYRDGMERGYIVADVCGRNGCNLDIDRGLSFLCYSCGRYFCEHHLTMAFDSDDKIVEFNGTFAGPGTNVCQECCAKAEALSAGRHQ